MPTGIRWTRRSPPSGRPFVPDPVPDNQREDNMKAQAESSIRRVVGDFWFAFRLCRLPTGPGTADPLGPPPRGVLAALRYAWRDARVVRPRVREEDRVKYG